jgi:small subunit ribosomal protein S20
VAHSLSRRKRVRQNETRKTRSRARKQELKSLTRKFTDAVHDKDAGKAEDQFRALTKRLDQVANSSTIHKKTAARRKSRLAKRLNALKASA